MLEPGARSKSRERRTMSVLNSAIPEQNVPRKLVVKAHVSVPQMENAPARILLNEDDFVSMLYLERRRAERTQKRFVLMLVDLGTVAANEQKIRTTQKIVAGLSDATRETDITGWYVENSIIGVIGTELGGATPKLIQERFLEKLRGALESAIGKDQASRIFVSFHFFPKEIGDDDQGQSANNALYPELGRREERKRFALGLKRVIDIVGSSAALLCSAPLLMVIAAAIKLTSKGPVLFRQERLGQYGKKFKVLKFRSMHTNCDSTIHEAYVNQFITGKVDGSATANSNKPVFKIQADPRITKVGHFLRKTSLDEVPQFWNVLVGEMSLVGPRPPVTYEYRSYLVWHRRRVLESKPGITGLWQVKGRSRICFEDMVRLDLKYARTWSLWLDLKILLQTPGAVLMGEGAH